MDANTQAAVDAGEAVATSIAPALGPIGTASVAAAIGLLNAVLNKGATMTMDDFNAAVALDDAAVADDLAAQKAAGLV